MSLTVRNVQVIDLTDLSSEEEFSDSGNYYDLTNCEHFHRLNRLRERTAECRQRLIRVHNKYYLQRKEEKRKRQSDYFVFTYSYTVCCLLYLYIYTHIGDLIRITQIVYQVHLSTEDTTSTKYRNSSVIIVFHLFHI